MNYFIFILMIVMSSASFAEKMNDPCNLITYKEGKSIGDRAHRFTIPVELESILTDKGYTLT